MSNYDIRSLSSVKHLRTCCLVLLGALYSLQVSAQSASSGDVFNWLYYQTSGNTTSVNAGGTTSNGVRDMGWGPSASSGNSVNWKGGSSIRNPSGNPLVIDVVAKTPGAKAAKIISAGAKALPIIGTGVMIWELCNELGFGCSSGASGPVVTKAPEPTCGAAYCDVYILNTNYGRYEGYSAQSACQKFATGANFTYASAPFPFCYVDTPTGRTSYFIDREENRYVGTPQPIPSSLQELEDAIASKSGWPTSSHIHDALKEAATATGQKIPLESPVVSGPSTSKGTTSTKVDPAAGTTTTTTTTHNHTYNDNRVTTTVTTSVNVTNNSTGQGTTTTTTEEPVEEQSECEKNPNSLNCSDLDTPTGDIPKTEKRITYEAENLGFAGGSCPADVIRTIGGQQMMLVNWAQNCGYITSYAKPMILAAATFAALMIIFVGGKLE